MARVEGLYLDYYPERPQFRWGLNDYAVAHGSGLMSGCGHMVDVGPVVIARFEDARLVTREWVEENVQREAETEGCPVCVQQRARIQQGISCTLTVL